MRRGFRAIAGTLLLFAGQNCQAGFVGAPQDVGAINAAALPEVSGIVEGRANSDVLWVHNDSGDTARFYAINHAGTLLGTFPLQGATATDWEDIAIGANPAGGSFIYLGDIGDNNGARSSITIYRTPEPTSTDSATIPAGGYAAARLNYPSGARNAESLLVDPWTNELIIITKTATPEIYTVTQSAFQQSLTTLSAQGGLGVSLSKPTAADISPDGRYILVRSKTEGRLWQRKTGQSVADALHGAGISFTLGSESQGEAIGWAADGARFYTTSESDGRPSAPIHSYSFTPPAAGDFNLDGSVNADDLALWQQHYGVDAGADADEDGASDGADLLLWQREMVAPIGGVAVVPEPTTASLFSLAALSLFAARKPAFAPTKSARTRRIRGGGLGRG